MNIFFVNTFKNNVIKFWLAIIVVYKVSRILKKIVNNPYLKFKDANLYNYLIKNVEKNYKFLFVSLCGHFVCSRARNLTTWLRAKAWKNKSEVDSRQNLKDSK